MWKMILKKWLWQNKVKIRLLDNKVKNKKMSLLEFLIETSEKWRLYIFKMVDQYIYIYIYMKLRLSIFKIADLYI